MSNEDYTGACSICVGALGGNSVVEVTGEVDVATVSLMAKALADAARSGKGGVILDAQNLAYIDSAGLQTLLSMQHRLSAEGRRLAIVGCHGVFHKLLRVTHLEGRFPIYSTVDEAISAIEDDDKR